MTIKSGFYVTTAYEPPNQICQTCPARPYDDLMLVGRTDETGSTERHAACGFSIALERCMHGDWEMGYGYTTMLHCIVRTESLQAERPVFPLQIGSRDNQFTMIQGSTEEEEGRSIIRPSSGSSIASLLLSMGRLQCPGAGSG